MQCSVSDRDSSPRLQDGEKTASYLGLSRRIERHCGGHWSSYIGPVTMKTTLVHLGSIHPNRKAQSCLQCKSVLGMAARNLGAGIQTPARARARLFCF